MNMNAIHLRLLERYYLVLVVILLALLCVGVPFFFVRKGAAAGMILVVLATVAYCWRIARRGRVDTSLRICAVLVWLVLVINLLFGASPVVGTYILGIGVLLAVVTGLRSGLLYVASFLLIWAASIAFSRVGWTLPQYFPAPVHSAWLLSVGSFVLLLLPVSDLIKHLGTALDRAESDATRRMALNEELRAANDSALAASRAKSEFLASVSHELRTPLNAVLGFSQMMAMNSSLPSDARDDAREIEQAGQHLLSLVNDVIDLARIEAGRMELSLEPVSVKAVVDSSLVLVAPMTREQDIRLDTKLGAGETAMVHADFVRLRQVLLNLLSNAVKYNRPHGLVTLSCRSSEGWVRIAVTDTGSGIPADKQARVFNAFDRLGREAGKVEGTGIGLVITRRIVEAMGGRIGFESREHEGSTFWVELPTDEAVDSSAPTAAEPVLAAVTNHTQAVRASVLYIEDNPTNRRVMQKIFAARPDLELREAETAELGIEMARVETPDMILMDIHLPGVDGYEALNRLKADPGTRHIPVVALTANAMAGEAARGKAAGFAGYLTKPLDFKVLHGLLDTVGKSKAERGTAP